MADSADLMRRFAEQADQAAFAELVRRHASLVYSVALRQAWGDASIAEEVTQEVFVLLSRKAAGLAGRVTLNGWLHHAAIFATKAAVRREVRRRTRETQAHLEETTMIPQDSDKPGAAAFEAARPVLDREMDRLAERERDALLLRFFENRSFADMGRLLAVSEEAARKRVDRALEKLRVRLGRHGVRACSASTLATLLAESGATAAPTALVTEAAAAGAVASTGVGGLGFGSAYFGFMTTTKATVGLAALLLLSFGAASYEAAQGYLVSTKLAIVDGTNGAMEGRLRSARERVAAPGAATVAGKVGAPVNVATIGQSTGIGGDAARRRIFIERQAVPYRLETKPVAQLMGIPADAFEQVMAAFEERSSSIYDLHKAAQSLHLGWKSDPALMWLDLQVNLGYQRSVEAITGLSFSALSALGERAASLRSVEPMAEALFDTDSPLTLGQADNLSRILAANSSVIAAGGEEGAVLAQASGVLSPSQMPAFQAVVARLGFESAVNAAKGK